MATCVHFYLPHIINVIYIQQLTEIILPSVQNIVGVHKKIILIFY
jgi:hypothetical protein